MLTNQSDGAALSANQVKKHSWHTQLFPRFSLMTLFSKLQSRTALKNAPGHSVTGAPWFKGSRHNTACRHAPTSFPGLFPSKFCGAGKALGTRLAMPAFFPPQHCPRFFPPRITTKPNKLGFN